MSIACIRQNVCTSLRRRCNRSSDASRRACIRQNVCTSLRTVDDHAGRQIALTLHTSKRMHFIEELSWRHCRYPTRSLHTSKRMHFIEDTSRTSSRTPSGSCIRQNVCTSLRDGPSVGEHGFGGWSCIRQNVCTSLRDASGSVVNAVRRACIRQNVCTSLRDALRRGAGLQDRACIRQNVCTSLRDVHHHSEVRHLGACIRQNVCTSLRGAASLYPYQTAPGLHTSKRIHFIEGW